MTASPIARNLAKELGLDDSECEVVAGLLRLGATPDQIRTASAHGRIDEAIFENILDSERVRRTVSPAEVEANGGLPVPDIQSTMRAFGLPAPAAEEPYFTPEEASAFEELGELEDLWTHEVRGEVARVFGQALGRIAQTEFHLFRERVAPKLREMGPSPLESLAAIRQAFGRLLPLADPLLLGVHRRKLEQEMAQAAAWEAETGGAGLIPGMAEVSLLFLDLRHFTSYANRRGDAAAIEVLERLGGAVEENLGEAGRLVKGLGDGYLLAYPDPPAAVASLLTIATAMASEPGPSIHAGLHHGRAVFRNGDYYGRAVNLAARLLSAAEAGELIATAAVVELMPDRPWMARGQHTPLGFTTPLEFFALRLPSCPEARDA